MPSMEVRSKALKDQARQRILHTQSRNIVRKFSMDQALRSVALHTAPPSGKDWEADVELNEERVLVQGHSLGFQRSM